MLLGSARWEGGEGTGGPRAPPCCDSKGKRGEGRRATSHLPPLRLLRADLPGGSHCGVPRALVFDFVSLDPPRSGMSLQPRLALIKQLAIPTVLCSHCRSLGDHISRVVIGNLKEKGKVMLPRPQSPVGRYNPAYDEVP